MVTTGVYISLKWSSAHAKLIYNWNIKVSAVPAFAIGTQPRWVHTPMITSHLSSCTLSASCSGWRRDATSMLLSVWISADVLKVIQSLIPVGYYREYLLLCPPSWHLSCKCCHIDTPDLCNSYVLKCPAPVKFCASGNWVKHRVNYMHTQESPVEIQTPTHWNLTGHRMTALLLVLLHNIILPPPLYQRALIPTRKSKAHI
jgi:hypothetical protein